MSHATARHSTTKKKPKLCSPGLIDDVQAALLSGSWRSVEALPDSRSIRSISYQDQKSSAKIDIDLVLQSTLDTQPFVLRKSFRMDGLLDRSGDETSDKCPESERSS